jgi:hypothetical protein
VSGKVFFSVLRVRGHLLFLPSPFSRPLTLGITAILLCAVQTQIRWFFQIAAFTNES